MNKFVEFGKSDSRLPVVKQRLEELKKIDVTIDPEHPYVSIALIGAMILAYSLLSYFPPHAFLFEDPETGEYGILID